MKQDKLDHIGAEKGQEELIEDIASRLKNAGFLCVPSWSSNADFDAQLSEKIGTVKTIVRHAIERRPLISSREPEAVDSELQSENSELLARLNKAEEALIFYRDKWITNADGDSSEAYLTRTWREPTDSLMRDAGEKARAALSPGVVAAKISEETASGQNTTQTNTATSGDR